MKYETSTSETHRSDTHCVFWLSENTYGYRRTRNVLVIDCLLSRTAQIQQNPNL